MMIYSLIIGVTILCVMGLNLCFGMAFYGYDFIFVLEMIGLHIVVVFIIDAILATIIRHLLPAKWFNFRLKQFHISKQERKIYEKLQIKKWKDKIPELGQFAHFRKNKLEDPTNNTYVERFILECCYGEGVHFSSMIFGFLIVLMYPQYALMFAIPVAIANAIIHSLSLMILRYNRPKLEVLFERNRRRANREQGNKNEFK